MNWSAVGKCSRRVKLLSLIVCLFAHAASAQAADSNLPLQTSPTIPQTDTRQAEPAEPQQLTPGMTVERELSAGATHSYRVTLASNLKDASRRACFLQPSNRKSRPRASAVWPARDSRCARSR